MLRVVVLSSQKSIEFPTYYKAFIDSVKTGTEVFLLFLQKQLSALEGF